MQRIFLLILTGIFIGTLTPAVVSAQLGTNFSGTPQAQGTLSLDTTPRYPEPGETVTFELTSYSTDLSRADISWFVDGSRVARGTGERTFETTLPATDAVTNVRAVITTTDGRRLEKRRTLRPISVDLITEANTYTPPLYKGKALYSHQSGARIIARPHFSTGNGAPIDPDALFYTWKQNGNTLQAQSGQGAHTLELPPRTLVTPLTISVTVSSRDKSYQARETQQLESIEPDVVVYEDDPILGIELAHAATDETTLREEATYEAIPYFFSRAELNRSPITYRWRMNGRSIDADGNRVTFRNEDNRSGTAAISVEVEHNEHVMQAADTSFSIDFSPR